MTLTRLRLFATLLLAVFAGLRLGGGDLVDHFRPAHRVYTYRDGLPQNTIHGTVQEPATGHLWVATQDGLARFNGRDWRVVYLPNRQVANYVRTLAFDASGALWAGTNADGLFRLDRDRWERFGPAEGLPTHRVNVLHQGTDGKLWIGTHGQGVYCRGKDGVFQPETIPGAPEPTWVWAFREAPWQGKPRLWVGLEGALAYREAGRWALFSLPSELRKVSLNSLWVEHNGRVLWVGTWGKGIWRWNGQWRRFGRQEGLVDNQVTSLSVTLGHGENWTLWAGTFSGLARWNGETWQGVGRKGDVFLRPVYSLMATRVDAGGEALWVGTRGGGLARLDMGRWQSLDEASGLPSDEIRGVVATRGRLGRTDLWIGAERGGLVRLGAEGLKEFPLPGGAQGIHSLLAVKGDNGPMLWVGTRVNGVLRWRGGAWEALPQEGLPPGDVLALAEAELKPGHRQIYAGTIHGLACFEGGRWTPDPIPGLAGEFIQSLHVSEDSLWVGTRSRGLVRVTAQGATFWGAAQGLPNPWVRDVAFRHSGHGQEVWIATAGGVSILDLANGRLRLLEQQLTGVLPSTVVNQVEFDATGRAYLMTTRGVVRLEPDAQGRWNMDLFTSEDGLPEGEGLPGAAAQDDESRLWVGTTNGLAVLDLGREMRDRTPKRLVLEGIKAGGQLLAPTPGQSFSYRLRDWTFEAALMGFTRADRNQYRFQLVGYEDVPGAWSLDPRRSYTNLGPGNYQLKIWGLDGWGNPSGPVDWSFSIRPAPWATLWARVLQGLSLVALVAGAFRYRLRRLHQRTDELSRAVDRRTQELAEARDAALAASRHKTEFLAVMSHEVRTPLNGILGMTELLQDMALDPVQREYVEAIRVSNQHLSALIKDVLDLSKIEADRLDLERVPFDPVKEIEEVVAPMATVAQSKGLELVCDLPGGLPTQVLGDPTRLRQVVLNLLGNAVKFTRQGRVVLSGQLILGGALPRLRLEVEDTGPGIPIELQGQVFEPFRQGDASTNREFGGTGLGLTICHRLVERMGGRIGFRSRPGEGTVFFVELDLEVVPGPDPESLGPGTRILALVGEARTRQALARLLSTWGAELCLVGEIQPFLAELTAREPRGLKGILIDADAVGEDPVTLAARCSTWGPVAFLAAMDALPRLSEGARSGRFRVLGKPWRQAALRAFLLGQDPQTAPLAATQLFTGRVLVVDDHPINRKVLVAQLRKKGLEAVEAQGGEEALQRLGEAAFDLVLMDCEMPGMDGFEATRRLREHHALPVVAITAHVLEGTRERCLEAGMNDYLSKPVQTVALVGALERWLGR